MVHEFIEIIQSYKTAKKNNIRSVIATVVDLDGSSYRKPGVRMMIHENGQMTGAVSGGCVEKEILKQSFTVFKTGVAKVITYDGRYRLGCEGVLYILIEIFDPKLEMLNSFDSCIKNRKKLRVDSFYAKEAVVNSNFGSLFIFNEKVYSFRGSVSPKIENRSKLNIFSQKLDPPFRLLIIGAEYDAVQLCLQAYSLGWEVIVVASSSSPQILNDFPRAKNILYKSAETLDISLIDQYTAVILMTHNYARDLQFLSVLKDSEPVYIGLLGSTNRRERLLNAFIENNPDVNDSFLDVIYGPTGLNIGAITSQEIALSICAEILSVIRKKEPDPLKNLTGVIHFPIIHGK
ncbi:MAG: XshC-Cox1-family protein [Bacteroidetes bacterium]|nr:MAG: XshC-Cox1-family protein [Bacteroidota bacterium]